MRLGRVEGGGGRSLRRSPRLHARATPEVRDVQSDQSLLDIAAETSAAEGIRQGLQDLERGRTWPARVVFDALRSELGIPR